MTEILDLRFTQAAPEETQTSGTTSKRNPRSWQSGKDRQGAGGGGAAGRVSGHVLESQKVIGMATPCAHASLQVAGMSGPLLPNAARIAT